MKRDEYLKSEWQPYPSAESSWGDVADFLRGASSFACGRISRKGDKWTIESGGCTLEFAFLEDSVWFSGTGPSPESVLADGDLVCLEIENERAQKVQLLAPAAEKLKPHVF